MKRRGFIKWGALALAAAMLSTGAVAETEIAALAARTRRGVLVLQVGSDWCVSGENVRKAFESREFARAMEGKYVLAVYDEMESPTEAVKAKNALVAAIDESLASGEDFDAVYEAASEDKYYSEGYYLTRNMDFIEGVIRSAFDMEIGEWTKVESDVGVHYIKRLPLGDKPWADENCADFFPDYDADVSSALFTSMLDGLMGDVVCNEDILSGYSVEASPMNTRFS